MPELEEGEKFKFAEFKSFKEQFYAPRIVAVDFETRTSKYLYGVGSRVKQTADIKPSRAVCVTQDEFGNPIIKTFVGDDKQSCAAKLLEELDRIRYNDLVRYIDDDKHAKDWRYVKNLEPSKQKLLDKWVAIHKAKTTCDCCHHRMKEYCKTCKNAMKTFYQDRKKNNQGKKNEDKDNSKFVGCESCVKK
ncbi:MAG: hypothetical protein ACK559_41745, partial [bacterium]